MFRILCIIIGVSLLIQTISFAQPARDSNTPESSKVLGYHIGVVQIAFGINKGDFTLLDKLDFYSLGFPIGIG